ncbi:hypothetical protein ACUHMQ_18750 [Chitinimonas sp. PSY-7]|uniref:hypothetical protein n=1 Tax=Chitinimonas sp. PSY-7 TaxID=3459088 RepID=UPI0040401BC4
MSKWIGVELEGTLAEYNERFPNQIGEPVNAMLLRVKGWLNEGKTVKVLSRRAKAGSSNYEVNSWLRNQGLSMLEVVPMEKDMASLWSARAVRVELNDGKLCNGCKHVPENQFHQQGGGRETYTMTDYYTLTDC